MKLRNETAAISENLGPFQSNNWEIVNIINSMELNSIRFLAKWETISIWHGFDNNNLFVNEVHPLCGWPEEWRTTTIFILLPRGPLSVLPSVCGCYSAGWNRLSLLFLSGWPPLLTAFIIIYLFINFFFFYFFIKSFAGWYGSFDSFLIEFIGQVINWLVNSWPVFVSQPMEP